MSLQRPGKYDIEHFFFFEKLEEKSSMNSKRHLQLILAVLVAALTISIVLWATDEPIIIKAKKIYTATQGTIENGMILIANGKISKVGKNLSVPRRAKEIKAEVVIPGLIDIHTHLGVYSLPAVEENSDGNEMTNPSTPQVRALRSEERRVGKECDR
jgi:hypothetical protein